MTAIPALMLFPVCAVLVSCCADDVVESEERSPAGDMIARVTYTNCGVLSAGTSVLLGPAKSRSAAKGDLVVSAEGRHSFIVVWKDDHTLKVFLPSSAREGGFANPQIIHQNDNVNGTRIEYHPL